MSSVNNHNSRQFGQHLKSKCAFLNENLSKIVSGEECLSTLCEEAKINRVGINLMLVKLFNGDYTFCNICNTICFNKISIELNIKIVGDNYSITNNSSQDKRKTFIECIKKIGSNLTNESNISNFDFFQFEDPYLLLNYLVNTLDRKTFYFNGKISTHLMNSFIKIHNNFNDNRQKEFILTLLANFGYRTEPLFKTTTDYLFFKYDEFLINNNLYKSQ